MSRKRENQRLDLLEALLKEVGTKFVLRTDTACYDLAHQLLLEPYAEDHLPILNPGELYFRAAGMNRAAFLQVPSTPIKQVVSGNVVHEYMKKRGKLMPAPLPCPAYAATARVTEKEVEKKTVPMEDEAKRIAYEHVLKTIVDYLYVHSDKERNYLAKGFRLESYLKNTCQITDPQMLASVKFFLKEAVQSLQFLSR